MCLYLRLSPGAGLDMSRAISVRRDPRQARRRFGVCRCRQAFNAHFKQNFQLLCRA